MKKTDALFLTHTNIDEDSRILKQMGCLAETGYDVFGIGVRSDEGTKRVKGPRKFETALISLYSRKLRLVPKLVRHAISLIELTVKMILHAVDKKPSVVHCNDTLVLPLGVLIKIFTGCKLIYDAHELESNRNGLSPMLSFFTLKTERFLWGWVDVLIVVSPSIAKWYQDNVGPKMTEVILNSPLLNTEEFDGDDYLRRKFSILPESKIFLYVGIFGQGRGIDLILEAFASPEIGSSLVLLGYGEYATKLNRIASEKKNIYVHEAVPHDRVVSIAKSADIGLCLVENVSLSDYYCLPNKLFEYAFSGIPVLASEFPDIKSVVDEYQIGFYSPLEVNSIRERIVTLQKEPQLQKINVSNLYPLSWKAQETKLLAVYKKMCRSRSFLSPDERQNNDMQ